MGEEVQIDELSIAVEKSATDASKSLRSLANALGKMRSELSRLNITNGQIKQIQKLTDALKPLQSLPKSNLSGYVNSLKKIPDVIAGLEKVDFDNFRLQIARVTDTMRPLADEMQKVANGFSAMPTKIQRFITQSEKMNSSTKRNTSTHKTFFDTLINGSSKASSALKNLATAGIAGLSLKKIVGGIEDSTENLMNYIENLNLFYVSMGEYGEEAYKYAQEISGTMGIDVSEWTRYQAVIMDMSKSFGVTSDTAYTMSKALTQLTYDFSSLYNLKIDEAATKVQSAIAGEIEPIRRLGKDLSVAKLQLTATELGINSNVEAMTQAEKAMLRTITLLRQSSSAQGDLARTLDQPANQMRILKAQLNELARALGEVFLPLLQKGLPYVIATVKVLRLIIHEFAVLAGFKLPEFEFATTEESVNGVNDALDGTIEKVEKLYQLSFDELNILGTPKGSSGTGSSADIAKLTEELNRLAKIEDEAFSKEITSRADEITKQLENWLTKGQGIEAWTKNIWNNLDNTLDILKAIGVVLLGLKVGSGINSIFKAITGDNLLAAALKKIFHNTKDVSGAFTEKNKKLTEQTAETAKETSAVTAMSGALIGAAVSALGLAGILAKNKLVPDVDPEPITASYAEIGANTQAALQSLIAMNAATGEGIASIWNSSMSYMDELTKNNLNSVSGALGVFGENAVTGLNEDGAELTSLWNGILGNVMSNTSVFSDGMIDAFDNMQSGIYDIMISGAENMAEDYNSVLSSMWSNYVSFCNAAGIPVATSFSPSGASVAGSSKSNAEKYKKKPSLDLSNFEAYSPKQPDKSEPVDIFNRGGSNFSLKTGAEILGGVLDKTLDTLKKALGMFSLAGGMIPAYASGGIVEDGMFYANSRELVGRFSNGKTAVANNEQITEGIRRAVYDAVVAATGRSGRGGRIELILDKQVVGRAFGDAIDAEKRRSGANTKITFSNGGTR